MNAIAIPSFDFSALATLLAWRRMALIPLFGLLCGCTKTVDLQSGLNNADANEIVTVLNRQGIEVEKRIAKEGVTLTVKEMDISRATETMHAAGLPRRSLSNLGQVFKKEGMISTPLEERVRYIYALSAELEYTLQQFDRVTAARVHVVLPERIAPGEPIQPSSAAVFVKYRPPLDEDIVVPRVRNLVASSIPGLSSEEARNKVSVVMVAAEATAPAVEWTTVGPFRVMAQSATTLASTLVIVLLFGVCATLGGLLILVRHHPKASAWVRSRLARKAAAASNGNNQVPQQAGAIREREA